MFFKFKTRMEKALEYELEKAEREILVLTKRNTDLEISNHALLEKCDVLEAEKKELLKENEELSKRTVSQATLEKKEEPSMAQILNEYLNGEDEE